MIPLLTSLTILAVLATINGEARALPAAVVLLIITVISLLRK